MGHRVNVHQEVEMVTLGLKGSCGPPFYHAYRYVAGTVKGSVRAREQLAAGPFSGGRTSRSEIDAF